MLEDINAPASVPVFLSDSQGPMNSFGEAASPFSEHGREEAIEGEDIFEPSFFEDADLCKDLLHQLASALPEHNETLLPSVGQDPEGAASLVERFAKALDRYQESPYLLHPYLERLVGPLVEFVLRYLPPATKVWGQLVSSRSGDQLQASFFGPEEKNKDQTKEVVRPGTAGDGAAQGGKLSQGKVLLNDLLLRPSTLGQNFYMFDIDAPKTPLHLVCRALYVLSKTSGEHSFTSHLPSQVCYYEDVFYALQLWKVDPHRFREWEVRYFLLLWLSNLILVPFELSSIDSKLQPANSDAGSSAFQDHATDGTALLQGGPLSELVLATAISFLGDSSKCREGAALLVARLLTRPDSYRQRSIFFSYTQAILTGSFSRLLSSSRASLIRLSETDVAFVKALLMQSVPSGRVEQSTPNELIEEDSVRVTGVLLATAKTLQLGQRLEMLGYAEELLPCLVDLFTRYRGDSLLCKTAIKACQHLCLCMLRNRCASWKYHRRDILSLAANLGHHSVAEPDGRGRAVPQDTVEECGNEEATIEGDRVALEEGISLLLEALGHRETMVRWSAAKGIGRVCERLPAQFSNEVLVTVYDIFTHNRSDTHWHGGLLALAEFCRRGLVDTESLSRVVGFVSEGLSFDLSKGTYSVGAHVRDAACYVCWSIARAYDAHDIEPHVVRLSTCLVATSLFDREVNVRRAAAAAFQECVGRLGNFPDGIALVTTMDFFSLASMKNAYCTVAPKVAVYTAYRGTMLEELLSVKVSHWDRAVRQYAARALGQIALLEDKTNVDRMFTELQGRVVDPMLATRHGAVLTLTELVMALPADTWSGVQREELVGVLVRLDAIHFFRSRGGEYLRQAVCQLLSACAAQSLSFPEYISVVKLTGHRARVRTLGKIHDFLEDTWCNILDWVQESAAKAFRMIAHTYYTTFEPKVHGKMLDRMIESCLIGKRSLIERRGFLMAIGGLPLCMLTPLQPPFSSSSLEAEPYYVSVLETLCQAAVRSQSHSSELDLSDVEGRRNAVHSLGEVLLTLNRRVDVGAKRYRSVVEVFLQALRDYTVDKRGDVGSFVRLQALKSLPVVVSCGLLRTPTEGSDYTEQPWCDALLLVRVIQSILRLMMEKSDRVRLAALTALVCLLGTPEGGTQAGLVCAIDLNKDLGTDESLVAETSILQSLVVRAQVEKWLSPEKILISFGAELLERCPRVYAQPVMEGLVLSAGDHSAHINRPGFAVLLRSFDSNNESTREQHRLRLSESLIVVAKQYMHVERVLVPLSRVLDNLMAAGAFAQSQHRPLVTVLRQEFKHFATTITVLLSLVTLLANLCCSTDSVARHDAWSLALVLIASRYPKVRSKMATELYTALLTWFSSTELSAETCVNSDPVREREACARAMQHILSIQWDSTDANKVREARNVLSEILGVALPAAAARVEISAKPARPEIVAGTYLDLVREVGY